MPRGRRDNRRPGGGRRSVDNQRIILPTVAVWHRIVLGHRLPLYPTRSCRKPSDALALRSDRLDPIRERLHELLLEFVARGITPAEEFVGEVPRALAEIGRAGVRRIRLLRAPLSARRGRGQTMAKGTPATVALTKAG